MIADPRTAGDTPRRAALVALAVRAAEAPWRFTGEDRRAAAAAGIGDPELVHVIALAGLFGHLNRVADAVDIELDYPPAMAPPPAAAQAPWPVAEAPVAGAIDPALALDQLDGVVARLTAWRDQVTTAERPLALGHRLGLVRRVGELLGDPAAAGVPADDDPVLAPLLAALAVVGVTEPWRLGPALEPLRAAGQGDAARFDAAATIASATAWSRIDVALRALSRR